MSDLPSFKRNARNRVRPRFSRSVERADEGASTPKMLIGFSHLGLGAIGTVSAGAGLLFAPTISLLEIGAPLALLVFSLLTCLAGLWILDDVRRGAILAIAVHLWRIGLLLLGGNIGIGLGLSLVLLACVVWLLPEFSPAPVSTSGTPR